MPETTVRVCTGAGVFLPDPSGAVGVRPQPASIIIMIPSRIQLAVRAMRFPSPSLTVSIPILIRVSRRDLA